MDRLTAAEVFVHIAERGSMSAAAQALDMSRAMVTRYLAAMEAWAGARLLHRSTRRLSLTSAGEQALSRCRRMLALAGEMPSAVREGDSTPGGLVRIACAQSLAQAVLAPLLADFLRAYPLAAIDLRLDARAVNLVEERIDIALRVTNDLDPGLISRRLGDCDSVLCAAPAYLDRNGRPADAAALALHNCLTYAYFGRSLWDLQAPDGEWISLPVAGNLSADESQALLSAALAGGGISMQPRYVAAPYLRRGELEAVLPDHRPRVLGIHALYASRQQMPAIQRALLDWLAERFPAQPV